MEVAAVVGDDAGGFLAAMLEGVETESGVGRGIRGAVDAEQRTLLVKLVEVVGGMLRGVGHGAVISGCYRLRHGG